MNQESKESSREQSQQIISLVDQYSQEAAKGSHESSVFLLHLVKGPYPDSLGVDMTRAAHGLNGQDLLALQVADYWLGRFRRNFGEDYMGPELKKDNETLWSFFESLSKSIQGILHPDGEFGSSTLENLTNATEKFYDLVNWAENELIEGRVGS